MYEMTRIFWKVQFKRFIGVSSRLSHIKVDVTDEGGVPKRDQDGERMYVGGVQKKNNV